MTETNNGSSSYLSYINSRTRRVNLACRVFFPHTTMPDDPIDPQRPVRRRYISPGQRNRNQALADWFGVSPLAPLAPPKSMEKILNELISRLDLRLNDFEEAELRRGWKRAVGDYISQQASLVSISRGTAFVHVLQPAARYHLLHCQKALIEKLQQEFGKDVVQRIQFRIG